MNCTVKYFFSILIILFSAVPLKAQVVLTGTIVDAHTKEPVSFASVYVKRTGIGNTSDSAGNFRIVVNSVDHDSLVVSYVGYAVTAVAISEANDHSPMSIQLQRGGLTNNVIVKAKFNKGLFFGRRS